MVEHAVQGIVSPIQAIRQAIKEQKTWQHHNQPVVKLLIDQQIMAPMQAERWANEEYQTLPKCQECFAILNGSVYFSGVCNDAGFCSKYCVNQNYLYHMEKLNDMEECDFK
jgi:hypothetical protein